MNDRPFISQETLDIWLAEGRVAVDGEVLTLPLGRSFKLKTAVHFVADVTETGDPHAMLGKVKDVEVLAAIGGEHVSDSVILGDTAYQVIEGFLGEPADADASVSAALPAPSGHLEELSRFFVENP